MPQYPEDQTNGRMFTRHWVGEPKWLLASQSEFDGLAPSQIVRYANAEDRGFGDTESQHEVAARLDATPDADNLETNLRATELDAKGVTVDAHRYVVDPLVEQHQYLGLYTAGPVRHVEEPTREGAHKRVQQVLTRTFCAGHGYFVDELGRYHPVWKTAGGGWTGVNPDKHQVVYAREDDGSDSDSDMDETLPEDFTPDMVREFATADEALMAHRPWLESKLSPYMALHPEAFPNTFVREVYWREFTHESIAALEELGSDRERLERVVAYHFTEKVAPQVLDAHCRLDPQTNTVVFVCSLMYVELGEPQTPDDLLDLPCIVAPCTRETLRMFGWNQLRDGEGYRYTHVFKWPRLKDTPEVRKALEFVQDNRMVDGSDSDGDADSWVMALLKKHDPTNPGWCDQKFFAKPNETLGDYEEVHAVTKDDKQADNTGRLTTLADAPRGDSPDATTQTWATKEGNTYKTVVQFYRIAQQKVDVEQDGSLSFTIVLQKAEWHGADDGYNWEDPVHPGSRVLSQMSAPEGWGVSETRVIPSVPRENAIPTMIGIKSSTLEIITAKHQTEGEAGHSDISFTRAQLYDYTTKTPENVQNPFGTPFNAVSQGYNPYPRKNYTLTYERVAPSAVPDLIDKIRNLLGGDPAISLTYHPEGYYTVWARGTGKNPRHIREWIVAADWYHHETQEQWLGVTVREGEQGFWFDPDGDGSDSDGDAIFISFAQLRGDLDANWMGSDPSTNDELEVTTGIGTASHEPVDPQPDHGDEHGNGWDESDADFDGDPSWDDPDTQEGNRGGPGMAPNTGNIPDKRRSHVITTVHPRVNEDGTWNFVVHRIYPHQRVHYWETRQAKKKGDWRKVYHAEYQNWPSRKSIFKDLVERFSSLVGADITGDDYTWSFHPNVNVHGLVDAGDVTIAPMIWNKRGDGKRSVEEGLKNLSIYKIWPLKTGRRAPFTKTSPDDVVKKNPGFRPLLGYYFRISKCPIYWGTFNSLESAKVIFDKLCDDMGYDKDRSMEPRQADGAWVFKWVGELTWGPKNFVYNGAYPPTTTISLTAGDVHGIPRPETTTDEQLAARFNQMIDGAGADSGTITRETWEKWFRGGEVN